MTWSQSLMLRSPGRCTSTFRSLPTSEYTPNSFTVATPFQVLTTVPSPTPPARQALSSEDDLAPLRPCPELANGDDVLNLIDEITLFPS